MKIQSIKIMQHSSNLECPLGEIFFDMIQTNVSGLSVITAIWQNLQLDFVSLDLKRKLKQIRNDCGIVASILST